MMRIAFTLSCLCLAGCGVGPALTAGLSADEATAWRKFAGQYSRPSHFAVHYELKGNRWTTGSDPSGKGDVHLWHWVCNDMAEVYAGMTPEAAKGTGLKEATKRATETATRPGVKAAAVIDLNSGDAPAVVAFYADDGSGVKKADAVPSWAAGELAAFLVEVQRRAPLERP